MCNKKQITYTRERKHIPKFRTRIFVVWRQKDRYKAEYVFVHAYNNDCSFSNRCRISKALINEMYPEVCVFVNEIAAFLVMKPELTELVTTEFSEGFDQGGDILRQPWF